jgi:hypothetical protein
MLTVTAKEAVAVAAGSFAECLRLVEELSIEGLLSGSPAESFSRTVTSISWYAPGVGLVKQQETTVTQWGGESEERSVSRELESYLPPQ